MSERRTRTFSMDAPECQACKYRADCKNKRLVACMYIEPVLSSAAEGVAQSVTEPVTEPVLAPHDYRDVKIGESTTVTIDLVEVKKKIKDDFYRALGCGFLGGAT